MISDETVEELKSRSKSRCENPVCTNKDSTIKFDFHHIYWKSQYRYADRDLAWNLAHLCAGCHYSIHSQANVALDRYLKKCADKRKDHSKVSTEIAKDILQARRTRRNAYKRTIERYKENHAGLSPSQVAYRRMKARRVK